MDMEESKESDGTPLQFLNELVDKRNGKLTIDIIHESDNRHGIATLQMNAMKYDTETKTNQHKFVTTSVTYPYFTHHLYMKHKMAQLLLERLMVYDDMALQQVKKLSKRYILYEKLVYKADESYQVEFKGAAHYNNMKSKVLRDKPMIEKICKTICAFLNTNGGVMYIGIEDISKRIQGVEFDDSSDLDKALLCIENALKDAISPHFSFRIESVPVLVWKPIDYELWEQQEAAVKITTPGVVTQEDSSLKELNTADNRIDTQENSSLKELNTADNRIEQLEKEMAEMTSKLEKEMAGMLSKLEKEMAGMKAEMTSKFKEFVKDPSILVKEKSELDNLHVIEIRVAESNRVHRYKKDAYKRYRGQVVAMNYDQIDKLVCQKIHQLITHHYSNSMQLL